MSDSFDMDLLAASDNQLVWIATEFDRSLLLTGK